MCQKIAQTSRFVFMLSFSLLSSCGSEKKDEALGRMITDCQMAAYHAMADSPLTDEKKHFALGEYVERCLKEGGLQPSTGTQGDESCFETPKSTEGGKGFIKPLQNCWKNPKSFK